MSDVTPRKEGSHLTPRAIITLGVAAACLVFVFSNTADVSLRFLWLELSAPGWVFLFTLLALGFLIGFVVGRNRYRT